jgi:hypothetical protein
MFPGLKYELYSLLKCKKKFNISVDRNSKKDVVRKAVHNKTKRKAKNEVAG